MDLPAEQQCSEERVDVEEAVLQFIERGIAPVPIPHRHKAPRLRGWPKLRLEQKDVRSHFKHDDNIGVLLGDPSNGLIDIDLDSAEARALAPEFLPQTLSIFGRLGALKSHWIYRVDPTPNTMQFFDLPTELGGDGSVLLELRSTGCQTVFPPSIHPSGERIEWVSNGEPARLETRHLIRSCRVLASAAVLARHWPKQGSRHQVANALAGMLLGAGWSQGEVAHFIECIAREARDEEWKQRARDAISTSKRLAVGKPATGLPTLVRLLGDPLVKRVSEFLCDSDSRVETGPAVPFETVPRWPEPLSSEAFHGLAGELIGTIEPHTEADTAGLLIQFLVALGNVLGRGPFYVVEQHPHYANLFALIIGTTSKGRKGTAWARIAECFRRVDEHWISKGYMAG